MSLTAGTYYWISRLALGSEGQILTVESGAAVWKTSSALSNPMTTGGDIIYGGASGVATRLANGSAGQVLTSQGGTSAPIWSSAGAGDMVLASTQTVTGAKTFGTIGGAVGKFKLAGSTSGSATLDAPAVAGTNAYVLPSTSGTLIGTGDTGTVSNTMLANAAVANLSGTNTGDNATNSQYSSLVSNATHTGDVTGATALTVVAINGTNLAALGTGILKNTTGTGIPSIAVAGDFPTLNQNTSGTAAGLSATLAIGSGGTGQTTKATAFDALSPMTTGGDIIYGGASGTGTRLANGSAGQALVSAGGTSAPSWKNISLVNANTGDVTASAADTYLTGSNLTIGGKIKAGSILRWRFAATKTAAGIATPVWSVRFGTNGSTADTARLTFTSSVQTGAVDTAQFEITAIVKNVDASGVVAGSFIMHHHLATTGFGNVARPQIYNVTSAAFDNSGGTLQVGVSVNPGASGVWTFQLVTAEVLNLA